MADHTIAPGTNTAASRRNISDFVVSNRSERSQRVTRPSSKPPLSSGPRPLLSVPNTTSSRRPSRPLPVARPALPRRTGSKVLDRRGVTPQGSRKARSARRSYQSFFRLSAAIVLLVGFGMASVQFGPQISNSVMGDNIDVANIEEINGRPHTEETPMPQIALTTYEVDDDHPRLIKIPRLRVHARVENVEPGPDGQTSGPFNIYDAGWHSRSAKPGENGAMIIGGHIFGSTQPGIFHRLGSIQPDDKIYVERGDGEVFVYIVIKTAIYDSDNVDISAVSTPVDPGKPGLNLLSYNKLQEKGLGQDERRVAVFTVLE